MGKQIFNPLLPKRFQELGSGGGELVQEQTVSNAGKVLLTGSRPLVDNTAVSFVSRITAVKTSTGDSYCAILKGGVKKVSGVSSNIDENTLEIFSFDTAAAAWEVTVNPTATTIDLSVNSNGDAGAIKWRLETIFIEVTI